MSKRGNREKPLSRDPKESVAPTAPAAPACEPFRRLPKLFAVLLVGFAVWLGVLVTLYFKTVYPLRHPSARATPATAPS